MGRASRVGYKEGTMWRDSEDGVGDGAEEEEGGGDGGDDGEDAGGAEEGGVEDEAEEPDAEEGKELDEDDGSSWSCSAGVSSSRSCSVSGALSFPSLDARTSFSACGVPFGLIHRGPYVGAVKLNARGEVYAKWRS